MARRLVGILHRDAPDSPWTLYADVSLRTATRETPVDELRALAEEVWTRSEPSAALRPLVPGLWAHFGEQADLERGLVLASENVRRWPTSFVAHWDRAVFLSELGRNDEAAAAYEAASEIRPNAPVYASLALPVRSRSPRCPRAPRSGWAPVRSRHTSFSPGS
jgi:hypothetical protein